MSISDRFDQAIATFDKYNASDPHQEVAGDNSFPKELLYAQRMSERLDRFAPESAEVLRLAARSQHIGRWEIPRDAYPRDRKGYLQWRNALKEHHAKIAAQILSDCGYENEIIEKVKFLLLKKELHKNADTQLLEDIICLVFVQYYLDEFAAKHDDEKVVDILRKTIKKMSPKAIEEVGSVPLSQKIKSLLQRASA